MSPRWIAFLALNVTSVLWGSTFFLVKQGIGETARAVGADPADPAAWSGFLAQRFLLGTAALSLLFWRSLPLLRDPAAWRAGFWIALPTFVAFAFQTAGLTDTSPGVSAFLTSLYVPATPIAGWILLRKRVPAGLWPAVGLALVGLWILADPGHPSFGRGEILSAGCGALFSLQILATDRWAGDVEPGALAIATVGWMGAMALATALAVPGGARAFSPEALSALGSEIPRWFPVVFTGAVATPIPFWTMNRFQRAFHPGHAGVIYATEPLFAALFSALLFGEVFGPAAVAGGLLVVGANAWAGWKSGGS